MFISKRMSKSYRFTCFCGSKEKFKLSAVDFKSTHWKSTIKVQDHPAEINICLGHSDSYTGVKQSTLICQPLTTSGQGKISFLDPH